MRSLIIILCGVIWTGCASGIMTGCQSAPSDYSIDRLAVPPVAGPAVERFPGYATALRAAISSELSKRGHLVYEAAEVDAELLDATKDADAAPLSLSPHPVALTQLDPTELAIDAILYLSMEFVDSEGRSGREVSIRASIHPLVSESRTMPDGGTALRQAKTEAVWTSHVVVPASVCADPNGTIPLPELLEALPMPEE